jgi:hypothetical protein
MDFSAIFEFLSILQAARAEIYARVVSHRLIGSPVATNPKSRRDRSLSKQRLRLFQIARVEPFGESTVDRGREADISSPVRSR